jgi:hypothetical protein
MAVFGLWVCIFHMNARRISRTDKGYPRSLIRLGGWYIREIWQVHYLNTPDDHHLNYFLDGLSQLTANEYLVLAGTLHGIHAITSRLSPTGSSSGVQVIEGETFKMTIMLTATGAQFLAIIPSN